MYIVYIFDYFFDKEEKLRSMYEWANIKSLSIKEINERRGICKEESEYKIIYYPTKDKILSFFQK